MRYSWLLPASATLLLLALFIGCSTSTYKDVHPTLIDGRYDSEFPYRGCSKQLEEIAESVKMVSTVAYYRSFSFAAEDHVRLSDISPEFLGPRQRNSIFINKSMSGTATIIYGEGRQAALLTCAHVVGFPDTTISYHVDQGGHQTPYLRTLALKERQMNFAGALPEGGELEVLAIDTANDIVLLGKTFTVPPAFPLPVFHYPIGRARELEWGSFVYLFGYPSGYRIVTKAIVSDPNRDKRNSFLMDAVFGGGFSGGIALAVRDGVPNFELVGMVKMVSARSMYVVTPRREDGPVEYDPTVPYTGELFVERQTEIEYGVSQAVSVEVIEDFIEKNQRALASRGYKISLFTSSKGK
jgi:hypothetical protein